MRISRPFHPAATRLPAKAGEATAKYSIRQYGGWVTVALIAGTTLMSAPPEGLTVEGWRTGGVAGIMAALWIAESIPIPVTALLPLVLFPVLGLADIEEASAPFASPIIFLFLGGFLLALAMQRWGLHRRVAIFLLSRVGTKPTAVVGGFLLTSAVVSMWVSNTATALMMLPIATSVVQLFPAGVRRSGHADDFSTAVVLAVAYGATTGGMATLIGTPPNALLAGYVGSVYGVTIGFGQWMLLGVPVMLVALPAVYLVLTRTIFRLDAREMPEMRALLESERSRLGAPNAGEIAVGVIFALTALAWIAQPVVVRAVPMLSDTTIAMAGAVALFMIPLDLKKGTFVMSWKATEGLPWGVLLLFGGGLSLARAIDRHGLSTYLGSLAEGLEGLPVLVVLSAMCFGILLLTELTSNTATVATFLPIMGALALTLNQDPLLFLIPMALAANCSYMMPVGTPPNAIVYGSGLITLPQMARAGVLLNILLVPILVALLLAIGPAVFGIEVGVVPDWAR